MAKTLDNSVASMSNASDRTMIGKLQSAVVDQLLTTGGLAIGTTSTADVKVANTIYALVDGVLVKKTTAEVDLSGTVTNAKFNVFVITVDSAGTLASLMGTEASTIGAVVFPTIPANRAVVGFVIINPTGTGNFVGNTTALSDGTVIPNAVYVNTVGTFNPNALAL
jgi:hypothetical protein